MIDRPPWLDYVIRFPDTLSTSSGNVTSALSSLPSATTWSVTICLLKVNLNSGARTFNCLFCVMKSFCFLFASRIDGKSKNDFSLLSISLLNVCSNWWPTIRVPCTGWYKDLLQESCPNFKYVFASLGKDCLLWGTVYSQVFLQDKFQGSLCKAPIHLQVPQLTWKLPEASGLGNLTTTPPAGSLCTVGTAHLAGH